MTFGAFFWRWFRLLFAIHGFLGLVAGYWDMRLSDMLLYQGQMARTHYLRAMQSHILLAFLVSLVFAWHLSRWHWKRSQRIDRERAIPIQLALAVTYLVFLILGVKLHLVWLETHLTDPEGLLWTGGLAVVCMVLYLLFRFATWKVYLMPTGGRTAAFLFVILAIVTAADAYRSQKIHHAATARPGPNVLLIVADTLRWDHVSAYGGATGLTPNLDALAREGALYEQVFSTSPWTTPSHAAMFTGQYPSRNGVDGRNIFLNPAASTLAETLTFQGYQTAGFINNVYIRRQTGLGKGFQQYEEFWGRNEGSSLMLALELLRDRWKPRHDTGARETRRAVEGWLDRDWNGAAPFFLFVHLMEPHAPYGDTDDFLRTFLPRGVSNERARHINQDPELFICGKTSMSEADFDILKALYNSDIRYMDLEIGNLLDDLRRRGILDNTLVIFTSDHGEHFGDHKLMSHELSIYDDLIRVPLILRHPATIRAGTRIAHVVQTVDLFPSILRFLNLEAGRLELQGVSILPGSFQRDGRSFAFAEYNNARAVDKIERRFPGITDPLFRRKTLKAARSAELKLIWGDDGTRELYDMVHDPRETSNLYAAEPEKARILEGVLQQWASSFEASNFHRQEDISKEALEELKALGYVQ